MTESLCYTPETNTTLLANYTSILENDIGLSSGYLSWVCIAFNHTL